MTASYSFSNPPYYIFRCKVAWFRSFFVSRRALPSSKQSDIILVYWTCCASPFVHTPLVNRALGAHDVIVVEADLGNEDGVKLAVSKTMEHYKQREF